MQADLVALIVSMLTSDATFNDVIGHKFVANNKEIETVNTRFFR